MIIDGFVRSAFSHCSPSLQPSPIEGEGGLGEDLSIKQHDATYEAAEICSTLCSELPNREGIEVLTGTELYECVRVVGNFQIALDQNGTLLSRVVGGIIIGMEPKIEPNFAGHHLRRSGVTLSLSEIGSTLHGMSRSKPKVAFLTRPEIVQDKGGNV